VLDGGTNAMVTLVNGHFEPMPFDQMLDRKRVVHVCGWWIRNPSMLVLTSGTATGPGPVAPDAARDNTIGPANASVTIDEWADVQYPACRSFDALQPGLDQRSCVMAAPDLFSTTWPSSDRSRFSPPKQQNAPATRGGSGTVTTRLYAAQNARIAVRSVRST
jgi:hypothetical protein